MKVDTPLEVAVAQFAQLKKLLGDTPPIVAGEYYVKKHPTKIDPVQVKTVVDDLIRAKTADGLSARYIQCMKYCLGKFAGKFKGRNIAGVTGTEIVDWLGTSGLSARTRNNLRSSVQTLFNYARGRR